MEASQWKNYFILNRGFGSRDAPKSYDIWGAAVTEVEVDVLTGEKKVVRADIIEDTGSSVNPAVDVGQGPKI